MDGRGIWHVGNPWAVAIRNLIRKSIESFALVGLGKRDCQRFRHPAIDVIFYNRGDTPS